MVQRIYTIPQFVNVPLSDTFLNTIDQDFDESRKGGVKLIMRFSYTDNINGEDAALDIILLHLDQLEPLLRENYDVIAYMEAGFIGAWGEWYYSTHGLNNTEDRRTVLFKILSVLPKERMVAVRTPDYKRRIFQNDEPLSPDSAFSDSYRARTGAHNDCFLASATDYGTYVWDDIEGDKDYLNLDNRFVPQGGETCNPSEYSGCENAMVELNRMRYSALNKDYHSTVLDSWINDGCMPEIERRLGYRFRLLYAVVQDSVKSGGLFSSYFQIVNDGWASLYNFRFLKIILRDVVNGSAHFLILDEDPRMWMAGDTAHINIEAGISDDMPLGEYELLIHLADPTPRLHNRSEYAIRLANDGVWEETTGYNTLLETVVNDPQARGAMYTGDKYFLPLDSLILSLEKEIPVAVNSITLKGSYPNPFNRSTWISFKLATEGNTTFEVFDLLGEKVEERQLGYLLAGDYNVNWQPQNVGSGIYFYKLTVREYSCVGRCVYLK